MKKITFLFALLCASVMGWATQICDFATGHENNANFGDANGRILLSVEPTSNANEYKLTVKPNYANGATKQLDYLYVIAGGNTPYPAEAGADEGGTGYDELSVTFTNSNATTSFTIQWSHPDWAGRWQCTLTDVALSNLEACSGGTGGGETPEPEPDPTPVDPNDYTAGGHTIHLDASYVGDIYTLNITSTDAMEGLGGSFWNVSGVGTDMRSNAGTNSYTISGDKKTITCQVQSNSAPNIYTPLYVLMPGEVNFGNVTLNWEDRTPVNSEYCNYQGPETQQDGHYFAITFETDPSGNVVVTIGDGNGAGACSFRNGGFEGGNNGLANFVVSADNFATTAPATDYFTVTRPTDGDLQYVLTKIADLPANAKIKHLSAGAIAWREAGADRWCFPEFIYTYGGTCNQLDAPTNVSVDANNIITFDAVDGASSYTAYVSLGGVEKYHQTVASGDELSFVAYEDGDYDVTVVASGAGKVDSDPSTAFVWSLTAVPVVLGNSEYCEHIKQTGTNTEAAFTWETDANGNVIITIAETLGGAADAAHFRGNAMALGNFKVGAGQAAGSNYFSHPGTTTGNQLVLTATNAPAPGEKIYYHGIVEYATSLDGNAWPTLDFEWTYGTVCSGKAVSAISNNNTMGTAVVQKAGVDVTNVDEGDEVSFIATVADAELYRFVNWTKGGVEVSTSATYVTTITESTNLIANFDYIRNTYCHTEINSVQNKKLYLTLGSIGGGQYQIKIEGSAEAKLTALTNANYTINWVTTDIVDGDKKMSGQDVPFSNARWAFDESGYGSATAVFGISEGKTWEDIYVWNHAIYFMTAEGEVGYTGFPDRYHIAWAETCADAEAPVFTKTEGFVLDANTVRLAIEATDNWAGMLTYTIARAGAEPIISNHASGEEFAQEITGLTPGTEYDFTVAVSDGVNNANAHIIVTPEGDATNPVMGEASLASKTWNSAIINVTATDNLGVAAYYIAELDAEYVPAEGKITVDGLTQGTAYTFTIKAKDAAGNISDNSAVVNVTTDAHLFAPTTAPAAPTWADELVMSIYSDAYTAEAAWGFLEDWGQSTTKTDMVIAENNVMKYSNFNYLGWQTANAYNVINMEKLHLDIWVENDCELGIVPIYGGPGLTTDDSHRAKPALTGQQWNSIDLDLATDYAGLNLASIFQFKFDQGTTAEFFIDNVYFYREAALVDDEAPASVSGNVVSQSFYSVTLSLSATDDNGAVTYTIKDGDTQVAYSAGASGVAVNVKIENLTPGTDYAFSVIAKDGSDNAADAITVNASTLAVPEAAPAPTYPEAMVMSLYSDVYAPVVNVANYCEWWWESPTVHTNHTLGEVDHVLFYDNNHQAGASFGWSWSGDNKIDFTNYQKLHLSVYPAQEGTIELYPVVQPEAQFHKVSQTLVAGQWNDIVLDYTDKTFAPLNQIGFINFYDLGEFFVDNVYFFAEAEDLEFADDAANATIVAANDGKWVNAKINRNLLANGEWFTLCLPFDMTDAQLEEAFGAGYTLTTMTGAEDRGSLIHLNFDNVDALEAGKPYLIRPAVDFNAGVIETVKIKNVNPADVKSANEYMEFQGAFSTTLLNQDNQRFVGPENYLYAPAAAGTNMKSFRCYFTIPDGSAALAPGKRARIVMGPQIATDIENVEADNAQSAKVLREGKLFIIRDGRTYNAQGQLIK